MSSSSQQADASPFAGYLAFTFSGRDDFTVGLLVLDKDGFPLDFRFSTPVQPTEMQRALYGESLEPWLLQSVLKELFKGLNEKPRVILTNYRELNADWLDPPLFLVERGAEPVFASHEPSEEADEAQEWLQDSRFDLHEPFQRIENALRLIPSKEK